MAHTIITSEFQERIRKLKQDQRISSEKKTFEIKSEATYNDFPAINAAAYNNVVVTISTSEKIDFRYLDKVASSVLRLKYAKDPANKEIASDQLAYAIAEVWKVKFFSKDLKALEAQIGPVVLENIKKKTFGREVAARMAHSHTKSFTMSDKYNSRYNEIKEFSQKVIIFNGSMASGKTVAMRKLYEEARFLGLNPIFITSKRSIAANFYNESHPDHYKSKKHDHRQGVIGVINSIVGDKYADDRKKCQVVFIDEFEDLMDHAAIGTLGQFAADRIEAVRVLSELMKSASKTVVADAMITDHSIDMLSEMAGGQAKIIKAGEKQQVRMSLGTKNEILGLAKKRMLAGRRVAIFMDYNAKEFSQVAEALADGVDKNVIKLNAEYFDKNGRKLSDLDDILKNCDAAIISPVVNAGSSITDEAYNEVFILAGRTLTPTSMLQSARRFRAARTVYVAFRNGQSANRITNPLSMMNSIVGNDSEDPLGLAQKLYKTTYGKYIADHAASKNLQFRNYQQTFLIAAEQMGFIVDRPWIDEQIKKEGTKASKAGRKRNKEKQRDTAYDTSEKVKNNKVEEVDMGSSEERTYEQQVAARTLGAMNILKLDEITESTFNEIFGMDIDLIVSMRQQLSKPEELPERYSIAANRVVELLSDAGVNLENPKHSYITSESSEYAYERLIEHVALNDRASMTGLELVKLFCGHFGVNVVSAMPGVVIKNILKALGYDTKAEKEGRDRYYNLTDLNKKVTIVEKDIECKEKRVDCNITEFADKYEKLNLTKNTSIYEMGEIESYGALTQDEKRLAKMIDLRKQKEAEEEEK